MDCVWKDESGELAAVVVVVVHGAALAAPSDDVWGAVHMMRKIDEKDRVGNGLSAAWTIGDQPVVGFNVTCGITWSTGLDCRRSQIDLHVWILLLPVWGWGWGSYLGGYLAPLQSLP